MADDLCPDIDLDVSLIQVVFEVDEFEVGFAIDTNTVDLSSAPIEIAFEIEEIEVLISPLGEKGEKGGPGGSIAPINFTFGDAPRVVFTAADSSGLLLIARVVITTPFDGAGSAIRLGVVGDLEAVMPASMNDPTAVAKYQRTADYRMAIGDQIILTITPGTLASAGAGTLVLEFLPDY
jgi:hypothetical protein